MLTDDVDFRISLRGYDTDEVDAFLERVATAVGALQEQLDTAVQRARELETRPRQAEAFIEELEPAVRGGAAADSGPLSTQAGELSEPPEPDLSLLVDEIRRTVDDARRSRGSLREPSYVIDEIRGFLALVEARHETVDRLSGPPRLLETETLSQGYAGLFHRQIFAELPMLSARAVAGLSGNSDVRGLSKRLRDSGDVIAVKHGSAFVFPEFQFSRQDGRRRPIVAQVNQLMSAADDPWGALAWWTAANSRLGHRRPIDSPDDSSLVELAKADTNPDDGF